MIKLGEEKTAIHCEYSDVEDLIQKEYDASNWQIAVEEECGNDVTLEFDVKKGKNTNVYEKKVIEEKRWSYNTCVFLNDLADRYVIPEGLYLIRVSW
jgi:hypothetical protein